MLATRRQSSSRRLPWLLAVALTAAFLLGASPAAWAGNPAFNRSGAPLYDLQLFHPAIDTKGYITVNASQVLGLWDVSFGLVGTLAANPLRLENKQRGTSFNDTYLLTPSLQVTLGLKYLELAFTLPVQINFGGASPGYQSPGGPNFNNDLSFSGQGIGDFGLHLKGRILNTSKHPVGLAILASVYMPYLSELSGGSKAFLSDGSIGIAPTIIIDKEFGRTRRFRMALNVGGRFRTGGTHTFDDNGQNFQDFSSDAQVCAPISQDGLSCGTGSSRSLGQQLTYGIAGSYAAVKDKFDVLLEFYGAAAVDGAQSAFPLEVLAGGKVYLARNSFFTFGGGGSVIPGQTQGADWRIFVGFLFEPVIGDRDGDGIKDDVDKCPDEPEDFDDFEDTDGCPDPDNDRDGICDPWVVESGQQAKYADICHGIDKCPNEPETKNGFQDEDGCPDVVEMDRDGDGIPDNIDKCPDDPEDKDGFQDEDGCPDYDNDNDTIPDTEDKCPNDPEDLDGFEDQDGCPDVDNDKDRIPDVVDKCPNEPETYNGFEDEDGCPDKGRVVVRRSKLEILDKIYFETDKAIIKPISYSLLDAIAATLKGNPQILEMEIQGHADERAAEEHNLRLTEERAQSVRQYMIDHGVEDGRLKAHGYGKSKPVCREHTDECWSKNRRVEFVIIKRSDESSVQ